MDASRPDMFDVTIAGAGVVGLATALAIRRDAGDGARVLVCDPALGAPPSPTRNFRAVAIAAGSRRFLSTLGVWDALAAQAQPMLDMVLTDSRPGAVPPPTFLDFSGEVEPGEPFAHMVFAEPLRRSLLAACESAGIVLRAMPIRTMRAAPHTMLLNPDGGARLATRLLVAADGPQSRLRAQARIGTVAWPYAQSAIVAALRIERDHEGRAIQHFLPGGPLALLPMRADDGSGRRFSIVWTDTKPETARRLKLDETAFLDDLVARIGHGFGTIALEDRPSAHPLHASLARHVVGERFALVGDAARAMHPLAGQGLNHGLRDAAALAECVDGALRLGLDPGGRAGLAAYERARRPDGLAMVAATDLLNRLFSNDSLPARMLRDAGLGLVDRAPGLKRFLMREASGLAGQRAPRRRDP